jgi:hypothetical protein
VTNRVRMPVPRRGDDPELVSQLIGAVLSKSTLPYPPTREMVKLRVQPGGLPRGMHPLTPRTANQAAEIIMTAVQNRLPHGEF